MFFKSKEADEVYHPNQIGSPNDWFLCHVTLGVKKLTELGQPNEFSKEIAPEWYRNLPEDEMERLWNAQEKYVSRILQWISGIGIVDAFINGADEARERSLLESYSVPTKGHFAWDKNLIDLIPQLNIYNFYLKAKDGSEFIIYRSETETVFLRDANNTMPNDLRLPQLTAP